MFSLVANEVMSLDQIKPEINSESMLNIIWDATHMNYLRWGPRREREVVGEHDSITSSGLTGHIKLVGEVKLHQRLFGGSHLIWTDDWIRHGQRGQMCCIFKDIWSRLMVAKKTEQ